MKSNIQKTSDDYLSQRGDEHTKIIVDFAQDYDEASERLVQGSYNAVITDLFFPKKLGSNDVSLGQEIVAEIEEMRQWPDFRERWGEDSLLNFDTDFPQLKKAVTMQEFVIESRRMKEDMGVTDEKEDIMPPSAHNQPLGVLVAQRAKERGIPYAIATSGHGTHSDISTPVTFFLHDKGLVYDSFERVKAEFVRNGQVIPFEEFHNQILAGRWDSYRRRYGDQPESLRKPYHNLVKSVESEATHQPFFTDAEKQKPQEWKTIITWMEYVVNRRGEGSPTPQTPPQK